MNTMNRFTKCLALTLSVLLLVICSVAPATAAGGALRGDVNGDGAVNLNDILLVRDIIFGEPDVNELWAADVNGDGNIDINDIIDIAKIIFGEEIQVPVTPSPSDCLPSAEATPSPAPTPHWELVWPPSARPAKPPYPTESFGIYAVMDDANSGVITQEIWLQVGEEREVQLSMMAPLAIFDKENSLFITVYVDDEAVAAAAGPPQRSDYKRDFKLTGLKAGETQIQVYGMSFPVLTETSQYIPEQPECIINQIVAVHVTEPGE